MRLKVAFPIISAGTGSDVYFRILTESLPQYGIDATIIPLPYRYEFVPGLARTLRSRLAAYDLIHSNLEYAYLFRLKGVPLLSTAHHCVFDRVFQRYTSLAQKLYHYGLLYHRMKKSLRYSDQVLCPSHYTKNSFEHLYPDQAHKMSVLWNGIDTDFFSLSHRARKNQILCIGTPSKRKGFDLLNGLANLIDEGKIVYVGASEDKQFKHPRISWRTGLSNEQLRDLYQESKVVISLSRLEGFGYTVAEALSCGCEVIYFRNSSLVEVTEGSPMAAAVEVDDIESMAALIYRRLREKRDREIAEQSSNWVRNNFSLERFTHQMADIYLSRY